MKTKACSLRLLALAGAATLALGFTAASAQAQTLYSTGATGTTGTTGYPAGGPGTPALDLSGANVITAGIYTGGAGGAGGNAGPGFAAGNGGAGAAAVQAESLSTVTITGGRFNFGLGGAGGAGSSGFFGSQPPGSAGPNGYTLVDNGGAITLFGTFTGGPQTLTTGTGTFTGTLSDGGAPQTFTYNINAGSITLAASPAPEPSTWALLGLGVGLLGVVTLRRQRRPRAA